MWDFLREMGETDVGGAAVINSGGHSGTMGFGSDNKVSKTRIANLAKMCGWLMAKGAVDLTIFKVGSLLSCVMRVAIELTEYLVSLLARRFHRFATENQNLFPNSNYLHFPWCPHRITTLQAPSEQDVLQKRQTYSNSSNRRCP